jgi:hypothetical protein
MSCDGLQVSSALLVGLFPASGAGPAGRLAALHLGGTRVGDVAPLRMATRLTALTFCGEALDDSLAPVRIVGRGAAE